MSLRLLALAALVAAPACTIVHEGDPCIEGCDDGDLRAREDFTIVVAGDPIYVCAAGVVDPRCAGATSARFPISAETRTAAGEGQGIVIVEDVRILAPFDRRVRIHDVATAGARVGFELKFRPDVASDRWLSVTPDAHDWSDVTTEVADAGPVQLVGTVSCRDDGCVDAVGQGSYLARTAPRPGALYEYQLSLYPIAGTPGTGYDLSYTVE